MNEFDYIDKYFRPLTNKFAENLQNDAAVFRQRSSFDLIIVLTLYQKVSISLAMKIPLYC